MSKLATILRVLFYGIGLGFCLTVCPMSFGIPTLIGILIFDVAFLAIFGIFAVITYIFVRALEKKPNLGRAKMVELRREDDILLQATAFSQSALWIYLNLLPNDDYITFLKWLVPAAAISFYVVRAYGKMKDSNKWRYRSMSILTLIAGVSLYSVLQTSFKSWLTGIILIDNVDVTYPLLGATLALFPLLMVLLFTKPLLKRYEIVEVSEVSPAVV